MFDNQRRAFIAVSNNAELCLAPQMANRHGLISGATGTGKTVTLQNLAETFSQMGVPVFAADVKGDLSGVAARGGNKESVVKRARDWGLAEKGFAFQSFPVQFWDLFGKQGAPVRATIADMGPLLLGRLLSANDTQSAVLSLVFAIAKDEGLELVDLKDLQKILEYVSRNAVNYTAAYGNISAASIGAMQRALLALEHEGASAFWGEPELEIADLMRVRDGKGVINILAADVLMQSPRLYTSLLLWLLNTLFTTLPEVGDPEKPKLVFFFDEAHLLFNDIPKPLLEKIEQIVRLIRSKGIGVYFISQSPSDIPDAVLGQLGNRMQHALRAYTPKDRKRLKAAAESFRANPAFSTEAAIAELGTGEALVSFLDAGGAPQPVERAFILPPEGQIGPLEASAREDMLHQSLLYQQYAQSKDRETAYELLTEKLAKTVSPKELAARARQEEKRRKEEAKARERAERQQQQEEKAQKRFWTGLTKSVVVPLAKQILSSLLKRR